MTEQEKQNLQAWIDLQDTLNAGDHVGMDNYFHPDFVYDNPSRPDLRSYAEWKKSPIALYTTFKPNHYVTTRAVASGDDIWVYCVNDCRHTGGIYMGAEPKGGRVMVEWFSIVSFEDGKITKIFSIADVLGMLIQAGAIDQSLVPVDPHGDAGSRAAALQQFKFRAAPPVGDHLCDQQTDDASDPAQEKKNIEIWLKVLQADNAGDWERKKSFFHPDFVYDNPSRPDLRSYDQWIESPMALYKTFAPVNYYAKAVAAYGDEVWAYCANDCKHSGGRYLGVEPTGKDIHVEWFSIVTFKDGKIIKIFSIADVLGMLLQIGAIGVNFDPSDPHAVNKGYKAVA